MSLCKSTQAAMPLLCLYCRSLGVSYLETSKVFRTMVSVQSP